MRGIDASQPDDADGDFLSSFDCKFDAAVVMLCFIKPANCFIQLKQLAYYQRFADIGVIKPPETVFEIGFIERAKNNMVACYFR